MGATYPISSVDVGAEGEDDEDFLDIAPFSGCNELFGRFGLGGGEKRRKNKEGRAEEDNSVKRPPAQGGGQGEDRAFKKFKGGQVYRFCRVGNLRRLRRGQKVERWGRLRNEEGGK